MRAMGEGKVRNWLSVVTVIAAAVLLVVGCASQAQEAPERPNVLSSS